ncbi:MAG TPA: SRPBCC domain-containing protein [Candidatus Thermoplasmatota archaeon]|nr:SRPBCC domain-containing protein [Candidatus Thermoplasmatota archaeon]
MTHDKTQTTSSQKTTTAPQAAPGKTTHTVSDGPRPNTITLRLQRTIHAPAKRIYECFLDADAYAKWLPPHGFTGKVHSMEPRVGGSFRMSFSTIGRSWTQSFGGTYRELKPYSRIVHTDHFETDDPSQQGEMTVTIELTPVAGGTRVDITQAGIPKGPSASGAPIGWGQSLDNLASLCEQELPF